MTPDEKVLVEVTAKVEIRQDTHQAMRRHALTSQRTLKGH